MLNETDTINKLQKMNEQELMELVTNDSKLEILFDYIWFIFNQVIRLHYDKVIEILLAKEKINTDEIEPRNIGINAKYADDNGRTLLHRACIDGNLAIVEFLITKGADIKAIDDDKSTPLHEACRKGNKEVIEFLITNGADIEARDNEGYTPLHVACDKGNKEVVEFLVNKGANIESTENHGFTPLVVACGKGHKEVVEFLVTNGADIEARNNNKSTLLHVPCGNGHKEDAKFFVINGADIETIDNYGLTPLIVACANGHKEIVEFLIDNGADIEPRNNNKSTSLHAACGNGNLAIVEFLVNKGANIESTDNHGITPLHVACGNGNLAIVEFLVNKGANIESTDNHGITPLHVACGNGNLAIVEFLVNKGANIKVRSDNKNTPLIMACFGGHLNVIEFLVNSHANVEVPNIQGYTPLLAACIAQNLEVIRLLLNKGANIEAKNNKNEDAIKIALNANRPDIANFIKNYAATKLLITLRKNHEDKDTANKFIKYLDTSLLRQDDDVINILNASNDNNFKFALEKIFTRVNTMLGDPNIRTKFGEELLDKICKNTNLSNFNVNAKTFLRLRELKHLLKNNNNGKSKRKPVIMNCLESIDLAQLTNNELLDILNVADKHKVSYVLTHILSVSEENVLKKINDILKDDSTRLSFSENILNVMCIKVDFSGFDDMSKIFLRTRKLKLFCQKTNLPKGFDTLTSEINISDELLQELLTTSSDKALQKILAKLNSNELGSNKLGFDNINSVLKKMNEDRLNTIVTFARRLGSTLKSGYLKDLIDKQNKIKKPINSNDKRKSPVNSNDKMLLINAILRGNNNEVRLFVHTQDINAQDTTNGKTALIYAIIKNKTDVILQLLDVYEKDSKNDISITDNTGKNALMYAIENKNADVIKEILNIYQKHSCDINITDGTGKSAIMYAIENNDVTTAESLINHPSINFDLSDNNDKNILMYALEQGDSMSLIINFIGSNYDDADTTIKQQLFLSACVGECMNYIDHYAEMIRNIENLESILSEAFEIAKNSQDLLSYLIEYSEKNNTYCNEYYSYKKNTKNNNTRTKTKVQEEPSKKLTKRKGGKKVDHFITA